MTQKPKKTIRPLLVLATLPVAAMLSPRTASALAYDVMLSDTGGSMHWDEYRYTYAPDTGWSAPAAIAGNAYTIPYLLMVMSSDASVGATVDVDLVLRVTFSASLQDLGNFGGLAGGAMDVTGNLDLGSNSRRDSGHDFGFSSELPETESIILLTSYTVPIVVGESTLLQTPLHHVDVQLDGAEARDATQSAAFSFTGIARVAVVEARVRVADEGATLLLLGLALPCMVVWSRRRVSSIG